MPYQYRIVNARLFLEPPRDEDIIDSRFVLKMVQPPAEFILASDEAMHLARHLPLFIRTKYGAMTGTGCPPVEYIDRLPVDRFAREEFFAAEAKSLWEASYSLFDTPRARRIPINLLVEYELDPAYDLHEGDARFLFLDCKQRFQSALSGYRAAQRGSSEAEAVKAAWAGTAHDMLMAHGIPEERLKAIIKEGTPKWNQHVLLAGQHLSFAYHPSVHWVTIPPAETRYTARVEHHPLN